MAPKLTDRDRLARNRARARATGFDDALHARVLGDVQERLSVVNRRFTDVAVVTGAPEFWAEAFPAARVVRDAEMLDLGEGAHDLVLHAMALHWADDPVGQLAQCRRALRPDGLFLAAFPGGRSLHELRTALAEADARVLGGLAPRVAPMVDIRDAGALLQRAGFALPVADATTVDLSYADLLALARDLRAMGEGNALADRHARPLARAHIAAAEAAWRERFPAGGGRIAATVEILTLTGWAPAESQPKPLRPGSAARRLADALGVAETPAGDAVAPPRDDPPD